MSHSNRPRVLLFDSSHKQYNGFIKRWLHCLTPESIGRFLANNILTLDSYQLDGHGASPKIGCPEHLLPPPPPTFDSNSFLSYPLAPTPPPLKVDVICLSPLIISQNLRDFTIPPWESDSIF